MRVVLSDAPSIDISSTLEYKVGGGLESAAARMNRCNTPEACSFHGAHPSLEASTSVSSGEWARSFRAFDVYIDVYNGRVQKFLSQSCRCEGKEREPVDGPGTY
jgi:hypothetical protein